MPPGRATMRLAVGFELIYRFVQPTPLLLMLNVHASRTGDLLVPDVTTIEPATPLRHYHDTFGNLCTRVVAPAGRVRIAAAATVQDSDAPDPVAPQAWQHPVEELPDETLVFLLGSRYCETDELAPLAWELFGQTPPGWARVQAVSDYVHQRIRFDYQAARPTRTALQAYHEQVGVCRDYAQLAIAFCRCLNIPARYCTGYLSDLGETDIVIPMDFSGWMEVYLGGAWHVFDPRSNRPRRGRVLIGRGRDATDVAISTSFGPNTLEGFTVWTHEAD
ncbi:MAG TPA: transglutaminase family protein [Acidocella sp.]|nr:transglutaminase family protein [Acidocella sp.]